MHVYTHSGSLNSTTTRVQYVPELGGKSVWNNKKALRVLSFGPIHVHSIRIQYFPKKTYRPKKKCYVSSILLVLRVAIHTHKVYLLPPSNLGSHCPCIYGCGSLKFCQIHTYQYNTCQKPGHNVKKRIRPHVKSLGLMEKA